ncbi:MAG: hypothetical protein D4Q79_00925 [Spirochaetia bacterium]|nr:MAG: hypothetical protein D4Q79_00925 [Spirochaetia bacterium]
MTKSSSGDYENVKTEIEEVEIRVVTGTSPVVPVEVVEVFLGFARKFVGNKEKIALMTKDNKELKDKVILYVEAMPGFRGIRSGPDDLGLLVVRKEEVFWDQELLKASLGTVYPALVAEEVVATVIIPPGVFSEEKLREGLEQLLKKGGVPPDDIPKLLETNTTLRIDVEKLDELIEAKRVKLLPGTKEVEIGWTIDAERLKTSQKLKGKKKAAA